MKSPRKRIRIRQKTSRRTILVTLSVAALLAITTVVIFQLKQTDKAQASVCENSYSLDWSNSETYSVTGGNVNSAEWSVNGQAFSFSSPALYTGSTSMMSPKIAEILLRITNSGNLGKDDTCWVNFLVNGKHEHTYVIYGDIPDNVFNLSQILTIPVGGNFQVLVKMKSDKPGESWILKNGDLKACIKSNIQLPVSLAIFNALQENKGNVAIRWTTNSETDNRYFVLERSANGTDFAPVTQLESNGNSQEVRKYEFRDKDPFPKKNFYRLRQVDSKGISRFSNIITAADNNGGKAIKITKVYPNPFVDHFTLDFSSPSDQEFTLMMLSVDGKIVYQKAVTVYKGNNSVVVQPADTLEKGTYTIPLVLGNEVVGASRVSHL